MQKLPILFFLQTRQIFTLWNIGMRKPNTRKKFGKWEVSYFLFNRIFLRFIKFCFIFSNAESTAKVLISYCSAHLAGKIHWDACAEVSRRSDTQRHMLERQRYG